MTNTEGILSAGGNSGTMSDIVDVWTQSDTTLPRSTLTYIISPLDAGNGGLPTMWRMDRGSIDGGMCYVMADENVRIEIYFAHGLTGEQRAAVIDSFGRQLGKHLADESN